MTKKQPAVVRSKTDTCHKILSKSNLLSASVTNPNINVLVRLCYTTKYIVSNIYYEKVFIYYTQFLCQGWLAIKKLQVLQGGQHTEISAESAQQHCGCV